MNLEAVLRGEGVPVVSPAGWEQRTAAGDFTPVGVMTHHTASAVSSKTPAPSLAAVINGFGPRPPTYPNPLPGPLCNILVGRDAKAYLVSNRRANDSGTGVRKVLDRVRADQAPAGNAVESGDVNGNQWFYDIEVENNGVGETWAVAVIDTVVNVNAAICRHHGWSANRCIGHREWTRRKIDPAGLDMTWLRAAVRSRLSNEEDPLMGIFKDEGQAMAFFIVEAYEVLLGVTLVEDKRPDLAEIAHWQQRWRATDGLTVWNEIAGSDEAKKYRARKTKVGL